MPRNRRLSRRTVLKSVPLLAALAMTAFSAEPSGSPSPAYPFTMGVASGDPGPDGMVLWTRLALRPLAEDGLGGMPHRTAEVEWQLASDELFRHVERQGRVATGPHNAHSVHVELSGLRPGAEYFYRFRADGHLSPVGRTRTAPPSDATVAAMTMCFASCSNFEHGWFTAYRRLAEDHPDLVLHLGDYQYEYAAGSHSGPSGVVREHCGPETVSLADYRRRHAQYKTDPDLQAAHAVAPWLVVFDDHELADNWTGADQVEPRRRAAALQAYYENMPLRLSSVPRGADMQLYRRVEWGALASFHMLDTRQYRELQPCDDQFGSDCAQRHDPARSLTGAAQEHWLLEGFRRSRSTWDLLGQQIFFSQVDVTPGPKHGFNPDAWDGYAANRDRILTGLADSPVRNAVILTGDVHSHWAAECHLRPDDPSSPVVATELVTTSITSGGDGPVTGSESAVLEENPHLRYHLDRRGYVRTRITPHELRADFRVVPYVSRTGAPAYTAASFQIPDGSLRRLGHVPD
jgi:alkaline phosphatase D